MANPQASCAFYQAKISHNEGRKYLDSLTGREQTLPAQALDVVFLALGFDRQPRATSGSETGGPCAPPIAELGVACLDTRRLPRPDTGQSSAPEEPMVETWGYEGARQGLDDHKLAATITQHIRIRDTESPDPAALRNVVLVGSSIWGDFNVLERVGVDFGSLAPVLTTLDISILQGQLFPSAKEDFTPAAFAQWLQADDSPGSGLGGGGSSSNSAAVAQAAYALHALLRLAIKRAEAGALAQDPQPTEDSAALVGLRKAARTRPKRAGPKQQNNNSSGHQK